MDRKRIHLTQVKKKQREQANHLMTLAKFLAMRTDDPTTGVGAIITNENMEIFGLGWNGFPKKARYGEFARASGKDKNAQDKKYPFVIHAEQNALMMRNTKNIKGGTLFVTRIPCNECTPLLEMQGIKKVVLGEDLKEGEKRGPNYTKFPEEVRSNDFNCFSMKWNVGDEKRLRRRLSLRLRLLRRPHRFRRLRPLLRENWNMKMKM